MKVIGAIIVGLLLVILYKARRIVRELEFTNALLEKIHVKLSEINSKLRKRDEKTGTGVSDEHIAP